MEAARALGLPALALTDRDGVYGIPSAHVVLRDKPGGPRLIVGSEVTLDDDSTLVLLAADQRGLPQPLPADHPRAAALREGREPRRLGRGRPSTRRG